MGRLDVLKLWAQEKLEMHIKNTINLKVMPKGQIGDRGFYFLIFDAIGII
jgi:hypothetical protein